MEVINVGTLTAAGLITLWGIIQTFVLEYFWFVKDAFNKLTEGQKKTVNLAGLVLVTAIVYGLSFAGVIDAFTPDVYGGIAALTVLFGALGINQGVHLGTKRAS